MLNKYIAQCQRFGRDQRQQYLDVGNLTDYINQARREVAMRAQCIRAVPPISGAITSWSVTNGGTGYSNNPTLYITPPDFPSGQAPFPNGKQATAAAIISGGIIQAIDSTYGGSGYFQPQMTITDATGKGATATPIMSPMNLLLANQEEYLFSNVDLSGFPGVDSIFNVRDVIITYANYNYSLPYLAYSQYRAYVATFPFQYTYVPTYYTQKSQGNNGSLLFYPWPSQTYQMSWDCLCIPSDLIDDQSVEAIPPPWTDAVPYFAAKLIFEELQNLNSAKYYEDQFNRRALGYSNYARIGKISNPYGRG